MSELRLSKQHNYTCSCPRKEIHGHELFDSHTNQSYVSHHSVSAVVVPVLSCSFPEP